MSRIPENLIYPNAPGFKAPGASQEAAERMTAPAKTLREQVYQAIVATPAGLTADEVAAKINRSILSVRPRVSELHRAHRIRETGARGKNASGMSAAVWVTDGGAQ